MAKKSVFAESYAAIVRALKAARLDAGLTQTEVAKRLRRPQSFVAKYEAGERRLDILEFTLVAQAIGIDPARLYTSLLKRLKRES